MASFYVLRTAIGTIRGTSENNKLQFYKYLTLNKMSYFQASSVIRRDTIKYNHSENFAS